MTQYHITYDGKGMEIKYREGENLFVDRDLSDDPTARWFDEPKTQLGHDLMSIALRQFNYDQNKALEIKVEWKE